MAGEIVIGYDGSECADAALDTALDLAVALGAPVVALYAAEPPNRGVGEEYREHLKALQEIGDEVTATARARAAARGIELETHVVENKPTPALAELAEQRGARMIVVGTWSERPLKGALLGSVPFKLLHRATVPVLAVPVQED
ncbi:MAG: universal stress protein [Gaiella sp.]